MRIFCNLLFNIVFIILLVVTEQYVPKENFPIFNVNFKWAIKFMNLSKCLLLIADICCSYSRTWRWSWSCPCKILHQGWIFGMFCFQYFSSHKMVCINHNFSCQCVFWSGGEWDFFSASSSLTSFELWLWELFKHLYCCLK